MKKLLLILLLSFSFLNVAAHKHDPVRGQEVMEFKMKFLAQEMNLDEAQQKKFFDLYPQLMAEVHQVFSDVRSQERKLKREGSKASDADYAATNEARTKAKLRLAEIEKKYDEKFADFLSSKQIVKMKDAEASFRKKMKEVRHKKRNSK